MFKIEEIVNKIHCSDALKFLRQMPSESVDMVLTSPPYYGLRAYGTTPLIWDGDKDCEHKWGKPISGAGKNNDQTAGDVQRGNTGSIDRDNRPDSHFCQSCGAWKGELGLEPTFNLYVKHLCDIFDETRRVLKGKGTCWIVLGDSYSAGGGEYRKRHTQFGRIVGGEGQSLPRKLKNYSRKSLCCIPDRFRIEMIDNRDYILRNKIIWFKRNCMPSSSNSRFTIDFEDVSFFSKSNKTLYWTNEKTFKLATKQPPGTQGKENKDWEWRTCPNCEGKGKDKENKTCKRCKGKGKIKYSFWSGHDYYFEQQFEELRDIDRLTHRLVDPSNTKKKWKRGEDRSGAFGINPKTAEATRVRILERGRNKRCIWNIPTSPFPEAHFGVFPEKLCETPILAGCPEFVCKKCGNARIKIYKEIKHELTENYAGQATKDYDSAHAQNPSDTKRRVLESMSTEHKEIGYSDCGCEKEFEGGIVLDPFCGAGTTGLVALRLNRQFIGIELNSDYVRMAEERIANEKAQLKMNL